MSQLLTAQDREAIAAIQAKIIGWSGAPQYGFFKGALAARPDIEKILMVGVYYGRDIAFILDVLARYHPERKVSITGVDKFSEERCADWRAEAGNWEQHTHGMPAPNIAKATANLIPLGGNLALIKSDDLTYFANHQGTFDLIYLDAAHDLESVRAQFAAVRRICRTETIIAGDDYSNENGWGVKTAVNEAFAHFNLMDDWVWWGVVEDLK